MASLSQPEISINKLGEFIYGTTAKKRSILKTIKFPSTFINARYTTPKNAIIHFMVDEKHDLTVLQSTRNKIDLRKTDTEWQKKNKQCCLKAMDELILCANTILIPYLKYTSQRGLPKIHANRNINGVTVHLNPDILLLSKDGKTILGAIRLIFSKGRPVDQSEASVIATIIKNHIEKVHKIELKESNCLVIDVFRRRIIPARSEYKFFEPKIKKACTEIVSLWPSINK